MRLLAQQDPSLAIAFGACVLIVLGVGALYLFRWYESAARKALIRAYGGLRIHKEPESGDVVVSFHTYHGLVAWFSQTDHVVALPSEDARVFLNRLLWFNFSWGLLTWGMLFVPILSLINYRQQLRSIKAQKAEGGFRLPMESQRPVNAAEKWANEAVVEFAVVTDSPTRFQQILGWILTGLSILFAISAVFNLAFGQMEAGLGLVVMSCVFYAFTQDWTKRSRH